MSPDTPSVQFPFQNHSTQISPLVGADKHKFTEKFLYSDIFLGKGGRIIYRHCACQPTISYIVFLKPLVLLHVRQQVHLQTHDWLQNKRQTLTPKLLRCDAFRNHFISHVANTNNILYAHAKQIKPHLRHVTFAATHGNAPVCSPLWRSVRAGHRARDARAARRANRP